MRVKNWKKFQHFKDRRPPWVKLYRDILEDPDWHELDGESAKILVMLWLIASEDAGQNGELPDTRKLAFRLRISEDELLRRLSDLTHWVEVGDIKPISQRYQDDAPETETETETETEAETDSGRKRPPRTKFAKPSREELQQYAEEKQLQHFEADAFLDYYESNGWRVGRNPMKSWQHAASRWDRENAKRQRNSQQRGGRENGANRAFEAYRRYAEDEPEVDCGTVREVSSAVRAQVVRLAPNRGHGGSGDD